MSITTIIQKYNMKFLMLLIMLSGCSSVDSVYGRSYWKGDIFEGSRPTYYGNTLRKEEGYFVSDTIGQGVDIWVDDVIFGVAGGYTRPGPETQFYQEEYAIFLSISYPLWKRE